MWGRDLLFSRARKRTSELSRSLDVGVRSGHVSRAVAVGSQTGQKCVNVRAMGRKKIGRPGARLKGNSAAGEERFGGQGAENKVSGRDEIDEVMDEEKR